MEDSVSLLIYAYGNISLGGNGYYYDKAALKRIKVKINSSYEELLYKVCTIIGVDPTTHKVGMQFRLPVTFNGFGKLEYRLVRISDDEDVQYLIEEAQKMGVPMDLYIEVEDGPLLSHEPRGTGVPLVGPSTSRASQRAVEAMTGQHCQNLNTRVEKGPDIMMEEQRGRNVPVVGPSTHPLPQRIHSEEIDGSNLGDRIEQNIDVYGLMSLQDPLVDTDEERLINEDEVGDGNEDFDGDVGGHFECEEAPQARLLPIDDSYKHPILHYNKPTRGDEEDMSSIGSCAGDELEKGMRFPTKDDLKHAVKLYHVKHHHNFKVIESSTGLWSIYCLRKEEEGCKFHVRGIQKSHANYFQITVFEGPHSCVNIDPRQDHPQLDTELMSRFFLNQVRVTPDVKVSVLRQIIKDTFRYTVSRRRVRDAKRRAIERVYGDWDKSYAELPRLLNAIKEKNPGTEVDWLYDETDRADARLLKYAFWVFGPCIRTFTHCRPIVTISGAHLYGRYKHKLLIAYSIDGEKHIVPLGFALVDEESRSSWSWFLMCLKRYVVGARSEPLCLISDRHEGIAASVTDVSVGWTPPFAHWRYCVRYVASNFNAHHKSEELRKLVTKAALEFQPHKFHKKMDELKETKRDASLYFANMPLEAWTCAYDGGYRFGFMTTNLNDCYDAVLKDARCLPVAAMVDTIFHNCVHYWRERYREANAALINESSNFTRWADEHLSRWRDTAMMHTVLPYNRENNVFEVITGQRRLPNGHLKEGGRSHKVNIRTRRCTCKVANFTNTVFTCHVCYGFRRYGLCTKGGSMVLVDTSKEMLS